MHDVCTEEGDTVHGTIGSCVQRLLEGEEKLQQWRYVGYISRWVNINFDMCQVAIDCWTWP